jgi:outer membrane immunogenic protein
MMRRLVIVALATLVALVAPARAADWTGYYLGGELGGKFASPAWTATSMRDPPGEFGVGNTQLPIDASSGRHYNSNSARLGLYAGYNWQFAPKWLAGLEGDWAWAHGGSAGSGFPGCALVPCTSPASGFNAPVDATALNLRWDASIRGRFGYLVRPDVLVFATGGVAWQSVQSFGACGDLLQSYYCNGVKISPMTITNTSTYVGGTVGGGVEWHAYQHWLLRGEYRFSDFGNHDEVFHFGFSPVAGDNTYRYRIAVQTHILTLGAAYQF